MQNIIPALRELLGKEAVPSTVADRLGASLSPGAGNPQTALPLAVARPGHLAQLSRLIHFCRGNGLALRVRGGNAAWFNAPIPKSSILLDMTGLDRILEINVEARTVTVQAGCSCDKLRKALACRGLFLPWLYPSGLATCGGVLATNSWCRESPKYGTAADQALFLKVWDGTGAERHCHSQNGRPSHIDGSLPLASLFCGSRGKLGIIGEAELSLLPMPQACVKIIAAFEDASGLANAIQAILRQGLTPASLLVFNRFAQSLTNFAKPCAWLLALEFYEKASLILEIASAAENCIKTASGSLRDEKGRHVENWPVMLPTLINGRGLPWQAESVACPSERLESLLAGIENLERKYELDCAVFGPLLSGRAQALVAGGDQARRENFLHDLFILDLVLNKQLDSDENLPESKRAWLAAKRGPDNIDQRLKELFDPDGIFPPLHKVGCQ